jgi:hypothetical protein
MKNTQFKIIFSTIVLVSMLAIVGSVNAAPVKFKQVVQVVNAKPGKANTGTFSKLQLVNNPVILTDGDGDGDDDKNKNKEKKNPGTPQQDGRVITITTSEIAENEVCDCTEVTEIAKGGFPKWTLFGLGAVPLAFIKTGDDPTPTPTPTTATPTPTTPPITPEPTPEPMTLLLFGTGLAGVGFAARKKFGKKEEEKTEE